MNIVLGMNSLGKLINIISSLVIVLATEFTHDHKRIGPINLVTAEHSCLEKFKVKENSIIRTQDSRELGAKFLNESDVGNREDCLNMCCNTRLCNVAVFEENSPFSCYLFDCGDPDDFRCIFTTHSYYTSAMINRHQLDLGIWTSQRKQESELASLRSMSESFPVQQKVDTSSQKPTQATTTTMIPTTTTSLPLSSTKTNTPSVRQCSRFQFECHSGECIAIYNACDGIPQCRDGSDEGADLECPQSSSFVDTGTPKDGPRLNKHSWDMQSQQRRQYDGPVFNHRTNILDYNRFPNGGSNDYIREDNGGYSGQNKNSGYYDYGQKPSWPNIGDRFNTGSQADPRRDQSSLYRHNYSDYNNVHQERNQQNMQQPKQIGINKQPFLTRPSNNLWQAEQPQYSPYSRQDFLPLQKQIQPQLSLSNHQNPIYPKENLPQNIQKNINNQQPFLNTPGKQILAVPGSVAETKPTESNREVILEKTTVLNKDVDSSKSSVSRPTSSKSTLFSEKQSNEAPSHLSLSKYEIDISELEDKDKENHSQASGAVLALSLGICITVLLVVLVGCRMKGGKRRMRRHRGGKSKLEHDADYLVNGMYL